MSLSQNRSFNIPLVDYVPAELRINQDWRIVFYVKNPFTNQLVIKRLRVRPLKNATERKKHAKRTVAEINSKLERGWNPYIEDNATKSFAIISEVIEQYLKQLQKQVKDKALRPDTERSYKSYLKNLLSYMEMKGESNMYCINFTRAFVIGFLDYIYYDRNNSGGTHNNYLMGIRIFSKYLLERDFISIDPTLKITTKRKEKKKREMIPTAIRKNINAYLTEHNKNYLTLCLATYFCFIRRTELTKIKVSDINLKGGYILIDGEDSKNHKTEPVTIPMEYMPMLINHISKSNNSDYVFSANNYKAGAEQLNPKKISDEWSKMRKIMGFSTVYQFYSLKDSGITELLNSGIPAIKVRDQARHHDLKVTEGYTARNKGADETIRNISFNF
ncbi:MAG: integrase [Kordia sp.]|nr:MAG: integrase [Kordia sp.]